MVYKYTSNVIDNIKPNVNIKFFHCGSSLYNCLADYFLQMLEFRLYLRFWWKFFLLRILLCVGAFTSPYYISHNIFSTNHSCHMYIHNVFISNRITWQWNYFPPKTCSLGREFDVLHMYFLHTVEWYGAFESKNH